MPAQTAPANRLDLPADLSRGRQSRRTIAVGSLCFVILIIVASQFEIRETAFAAGQTVPGRMAVTVGHLDGGRIAEIRVEPGDEVEAGSILAQLDPLEAATNLDLLEAEHAALAMEHARLDALIHRTPLTFDGLDPSAEAAEEQRALLKAELDAIALMETAAEAEIVEFNAEITAGAQQVAAARTRVEIAERRREMSLSVFDRGYNSEEQVLDAQARLETVRTEMMEAEREVALARRQKATAVSELARAKAEAERGWITRKTTLSHEIAAVERKIIRERERLRQQTVTSPISGIVQEVEPTGPGAIVNPGATVATIVPLDTPVHVEVRLSPRDIGHVREGDPAAITVDTFEEKRFGRLDAHVENISATTFEDENGQPYYRLRLAIAEGSSVLMERLRPGMTLQARISTGAKSLLIYFLNPVLRPLSTAFSER